MTKDRKFGIVLDLRCLQDPSYATRGVGRHALALIRHAPRSVRLIGLVDETLPALLPEALAAVEQVHGNAYAAGRDGPTRACVMLSPMTHDPIFVARLLSDRTLLRAAVVYDFIPYRWPDRYLPGPSERLAYAMALRWLARCDLFAPISQSSTDDLVTLTGAPPGAIAVTGAPLDPIFEQSPHAPSRHILVVGGGDSRKNPEMVVRAHANSHLLQRGDGVPLVIAGNYGPADAAAFRAIASASGGRADLVEVPGHVSDAVLLDLYGWAFAIVSSSRDEGFSLPLIEGMAAGLPCLASDIPAHAELVVGTDCRFSLEDDAILGLKLERIVTDASWRTIVLARQASVWPRFRATDVAGRFWDAMLSRLETRAPPLQAPTVRRGHRPRVALMSPVPPDRSGVADYTAATCAELGRLVDLHVFTETKQPAKLHHVASVRPIDTLPHVSADFDRVISVIGNSQFHLRIFDLLHRYGGACIAHDARLLDFYRVLIGVPRALKLATEELGRPVTEAELQSWAEDESKLNALFLGEIAKTAAPTIVHSPVTARLFRKRYGTDPVYLPFSIYRPWTTAELAPGRREAARERLGIPPGEVVVATFGAVHSTKAPEECVWALEFLRGWGIPGSLHFVGNLAMHPDASGLRALVAALGLPEKVRFVENHVSEQTYRDYLVGADLGVQLRTYGLGALSGGLLDCAAVGLPSVTNVSLGEAVGVPAAYVRCIPDAISPLLLAEALADLLDAGLAAARPEAARRAFSEPRSFANYATGLCHSLGLETESLAPSLLHVT
ncbi:glycosyltransferase [Lichenicoccus sp.]|uniref:glycosyltransferase n=1 Tax=Lichenicoccus sp. TaxID=2781899 RepID=UPI003D101F4C